MDFGFLATANSITGKYFEQTAAGRSSVTEINKDAERQFSRELEVANKPAVNAVSENDNMHKDYSPFHEDPIKEHAARLGFSIDNRVIDMLNVQLSDDMNRRISFAMNNAMDSYAASM
jgi:hypothetical protein